MSRPLFPHFGAFESTRIHGTRTDIVATTRHLERWRDDLHLLLESGITELRYPALWHRIQSSRFEWDFRWTDGPMRFMQEHGMRPVIDLVHHTSFPRWLEDGFANPQFPELFIQYAEAFAERYPWVDRYTVFNEPLPTTLFCSYLGMWYPYLRSDRDFVQMTTNVCKAICGASNVLKRRNPAVQLVHIDTCEHHTAAQPSLKSVADFGNHRRFLFHDLILGRVDRFHPLADYLNGNGFTQSDMGWFHQNATVMDVLGLDYYIHSEIEWADRGSGRIGTGLADRLRGFAAIAHDYRARYQVPIILGETNIRGTVADRLTWLKLMEEQCEQLVFDNVDFRGFCWFPSIDSTDWRYCCTKSRCKVDPQGIWWLDARWRRHASELSECYALLAQGKITSADLPARLFEPPLDAHIWRMHPLAKHWPEWYDSVSDEKAA
jgi:Glycosyl hydrolase family 1